MPRWENSCNSSASWTGVICKSKYNFYTSPDVILMLRLASVLVSMLVIRFKDCVKTGDGIRAKKSSLGLSRWAGLTNSLPNYQITWQISWQIIGVDLTNKLTIFDREELTRLGGDELTKFRKGEFVNIAGRQIINPGRMPPTAQKSFQYENLLT